MNKYSNLSSQPEDHVDSYMKYLGFIMALVVILLLGFATKQYYENKHKEEVFKECMKIHDISECYDEIETLPGNLVVVPEYNTDK